MLFVSSLLSWLVVSTYFGIYRSRHNVESHKYTYGRVARALLVWAAVTEASTFLLKLQTLSRQFSLSFAVIASALIILRHYLQVRFSGVSKNEGRKAIILGGDREVRWLAHALSAKPAWRGDAETAELKWLPELAKKYMQSGRLSEAVDFFIVSANQDMRMVESCTLQLLKQNRAVHIVPTIIDTTLFRRSLGDLNGVPVITLERGRLSGFEARVKRVLDAALASALLLLLMPFMALIAAAVKLTSAGAIIFSQERLGKDGRPFKIYKFRTMRADAELLLRNSPELYAKYKQNNFKLPDGEDFRITRIGRFLRATSLDELPQLFNVVRGDMSLVGPRPIVPAEIEKYGDYGALLLSAKPGMTGQWQVNGRAKVVDYAHRVRLDMEYIRDQSFRSDVEILAKTIAAVTRMEGAH